MLSIKIVGAKAIVGMMKKAAEELPDRMFHQMRLATLLLQRTVMKEKLSGQVLGVRTGRLRASITARTTKEEGDIIGKVGTNVVYGKFWEKGGVIPAHTIRPRRKKVLRFEIQGKEVFAAFVRKPERRVKARPFLAPALKEKTEVIHRMLGKAVEEAVR